MYTEDPLRHMDLWESQDTADILGRGACGDHQPHLGKAPMQSTVQVEYSPWRCRYSVTHGVVRLGPNSRAPQDRLRILPTHTQDTF